MAKNCPDFAHPFERRIPSAPIQARYRGCLLGGAVGDALGAPVEFLCQKEIIERFGQQGITDLSEAYGKVGAITDDTQMTLFTAEGLLRAYVRWMLRGICHTPSVIHKAYRRWLLTQMVRNPPTGKDAPNGWLIGHHELFSCRAPGRTCIDALRNNSEIGEPARNDSKGCGGVMRVAPVGMFFHALTQSNSKACAENYQRAFDVACEAAALTHGHPTGQLTAGVMTTLVFDLLDGSDLDAAIARSMSILAKRTAHEETLVALELAQRLHQSDTSPADAIHQMGEGWIAEEALAIGVYCALKATDFRSGVIMAVNHDGDSDSTGLITGHLLGAMHGEPAIPHEWLQPLELRNVIEEMADDLATVSDWRLDEWEDPAACAEENYYVQRYPGG